MRHIAENEQYMKQQQIRFGVYKAICLAVKHHAHGLPMQISIMQLLQYYEHTSEYMADCLDILAREFDHSQLGDEILREIASMNFSTQDNKGPRAFSRFLIRFAELAPRQVFKQLTSLQSQLDSEVGTPPAFPILRLHLNSRRRTPCVLRSWKSWARSSTNSLRRHKTSRTGHRRRRT